VTRRMLINAQRPEEVRIAIVTDGVLDQFEIAATESGLCRGNIYRGVVANVQPSLDAAFVNFGVEKDGLLRADDVVAEACHRKPDGGGKHPRIDRILERGRPVLVQVVRDGVGHKGALVTTNISIAGRYLVLMPFDDVRGVSRKAEDDDRQAVKDRVAKLELPEGCGVILRTNALDQPQKTLNRDLSALLRLWKKIREEAGAGKGPRLLYSDQDLIVQALRDSLDSSISEILVDDTEAFDKAQSYMRTFMPRSGSRLIHYTDRMPLFSRYELEEQIDRIYQRQIGLPSGGSIVIDGTEALTAIDVNSGRATRGANQEETAYKTNLEAAREVARQLRLRDIGGLMVVDFIDMRSSKHQRAVEKAMRDAMKNDKARSSVGRLSDNGLLEINRQRLKKALQLRTYRPCPTCSGTGSIASPELVALNILRRIETRAVTGQLGGVRVELHPELADAIQNVRRQELAALEREFDIEVEIIAAAGLHRAEERIEWRPRAKTEPRPTAPAVSAADIGEAFGRQAQPPDAEEPEVRDGRATKDPDAVNDTAPDKAKPRRRRRGGRKHRKSTGGDDGPAADGAAEGGEPHPSEQAAAPASEDHETAAAPANGDDEAAPPVKKKRRRPRRSRKKSAQTGEPTPSNESSEPSPPEPIQPEPEELDPFSY
jgi:ribonuclease E